MSDSQTAGPTAGLRFEKRGHRATIRGKVDGFPEFSHIGHDTFTKVGNLHRHQHRGEFEFCLIARGHVTWWAQERIYELRGGDVYFTWPDEPHGGLHELMHPCEIYWTTIRVPRPGQAGSRRLLRLPAEESLALCRAIHALPDRHLRGAEKLEPHFKAILEHLGTRTVFGVIQARAAMQQMLATLVSLPLATEPEGFVPPGVRRAQVFLDDCPRPWPSVGELAKLAGMSVSHFHESFRKGAGMAPMEYAHRKRLEAARKLLAESGATVTGVASRLGYCSSQHLASCFRRYLGISPSGAKGR